MEDVVKTFIMNIDETKLNLNKNQSMMEPLIEMSRLIITGQYKNYSEVVMYLIENDKIKGEDLVKFCALGMDEAAKFLTKDKS